MKQKLLFVIVLLFVLSVQSQQSIIGGDDTTINENPWQISIRTTNDFFNPQLINQHWSGGSILT